MHKGLKTISILLFVLLAVSLFAEKPLERIANEQGVEAEGYYTNKEFSKAGPKFEEAIATLKKAVGEEGIPMDKEKADRWLLLAYQSYFQAKMFNDAVRTQDLRIADSPKDYKLIKEKALIQTKYMEDPDAGIATLKKFDETNSSFQARKSIANYYDKYKSDTKNSLAWYQKAFELKQDSRVLQKIATFHKELGNNSEAIKAYENYIETEDSDSKLNIAYKNLATLYDDLGNNRKSVQYFEKANNIKTDDKITLLLMTKYYDLKDYDSTLKKAAQYNKLNPGNVDSIYYQAMVKYDRGDKAAAKADFEKLVNDSRYGKSAKGYIESIQSE